MLPERGVFGKVFERDAASRHVRRSPPTVTDLDDLSLFLAVADAGGFAAAETRTGLPRSTLSRAVQRLERTLGAPLAERSPRRFALTAAGEIYRRAAADALETLDRARDRIRRGTVGETVRLTAPTLLARRLIEPFIARLAEEKDAPSIVLLVSNDKLDLTDGHIDIAVRVGDAGGDEQIARRLFDCRERLYAAPDFLTTLDATPTIDDLDRLPTIWEPDGGGSASGWRLARGDEIRLVRPQAPLRVDDPESALRLAVEGLGITRLPDFVGDAECRGGRLERVLSDWSSEPVTVRAILGRGRDLAPAARDILERLVAASALLVETR